MIPELVAHRGYMQHYPENTLPGLQAAIDAGACYIEFDVQMTADEQFVALHDSQFARTSGQMDSVFDLTLKAAQRISVHEQQRFQEKYAGIRAPSLQQCLQLLDENKQVKALVEIKEESLDRWGLHKTMDRLFIALKHHVEQCMIISFDYEAIAYTKSNSNYHNGWVLHEYSDKNHLLAHKLKPDYLVCNHAKITEGASLWQGPWNWMLYDIADPELALNWGKQGAHLIETRDIGAMLKNELLARKRCYGHRA